MNHNLLDQADALMRRRSFVAGTGTRRTESAQEPEAAADSALEDVPVLTDVVSDDLVTQHSQSPAAGSGMAKAEAGVALRTELALRQRVNQVLMERQTQLTQEIEAWLDEQMPQLVIRAMDGITDHLVALLANRAKDELLPRLEAALKPAEAAESEPDSAV